MRERGSVHRRQQEKQASFRGYVVQADRYREKDESSGACDHTSNEHEPLLLEFLDQISRLPLFIKVDLLSIEDFAEAYSPQYVGDKSQRFSNAKHEKAAE